MSDPSDNEGAKGFGGLKGLSARKAKPSPPEIPEKVPPVAAEPQLPPAWKAPDEPQRQPRVSQTAAPKSRGWAVAGIVVVGGLIGFGWLASLGGSNQAPPSRPLGPASTSPAADYLAQDTPPAPEVPTAAPEIMPAVGANHVLGGAQLRYCVFQGIRINGAEKAVDEYNGGAVDHFNAMVNDFNSRCGAFQYRRGALAPIEREGDAIRAQLEEEGRLSMAAFTSASAASPNASDLALDDAADRTEGADYGATAAADAAAAAADAIAAADAAEAAGEAFEPSGSDPEPGDEELSDCREVNYHFDEATGKVVTGAVYSYKKNGILHYTATKPEGCA